jgi:hypothetical protein
MKNRGARLVDEFYMEEARYVLYQGRLVAVMISISDDISVVEHAATMASSTTGSGTGYDPILNLLQAASLLSQESHPTFQ